MRSDLSSSPQLPSLSQDQSNPRTSNIFPLPLPSTSHHTLASTLLLRQPAKAVCVLVGGEPKARREICLFAPALCRTASEE